MVSSSASAGKALIPSERLPNQVGSTPWLGRTRRAGAGATDLLLYFRLTESAPMMAQLQGRENRSLNLADTECGRRHRATG